MKYLSSDLSKWKAVFLFLMIDLDSKLMSHLQVTCFQYKMAHRMKI